QPNITGVANVTVTISDGTNTNTYPFKVTVLPSPSYYWDILAGSAAGTGTFANGTGTSAGFKAPQNMVMDPDGNLIVSDTGNFRIRKVTPQGLVTTLVGSGVDGYNLLSAGGSANVNKADPLQTIIAGMQNCTVAPNRDIYFTDVWTPSTSSNVVRLRAVRWDTATNAYKATVTVDENPGFLSGMMVTPDNLSLIYYTGTEIRKYNLATRTTTSIAGSSTVSGTADGTGSSALFTGISGISFDSNNDILVNQANNEIRKVTLQGVVTTINPNLTGTSSRANVLPLPNGAYLRSIGNNALQYSANGDSATIAGSTTAGTAVGLNLNATFNVVSGLVAGSGDLIYLLSST
ncbi:MAG: hypothetical protein EBQ87_00040, partial [Planctomycetes bacterium]|nr:hypothetical protein [Planctomycetota bacterium]